MFKHSMEQLKKNIWISIQYIFVAMICGIIFGFVSHGNFTLRYIFPAGFLLGAIIIFIGLSVLVVPSKPTGNLVDHSTYKEKIVESRKQKYQKANDILYLGLCVSFITSVFQMVLSWIL